MEIIPTVNCDTPEKVKKILNYLKPDSQTTLMGFFRKGIEKMNQAKDYLPNFNSFFSPTTSTDQKLKDLSSPIVIDENNSDEQKNSSGLQQLHKPVAPPSPHSLPLVSNSLFSTKSNPKNPSPSSGKTKKRNGKKASSKLNSSTESDRTRPVLSLPSLFSKKTQPTPTNPPFTSEYIDLTEQIEDDEEEEEEEVTFVSSKKLKTSTSEQRNVGIHTLFGAYFSSNSTNKLGTK